MEGRGLSEERVVAVVGGGLFVDSWEEVSRGGGALPRQVGTSTHNYVNTL